MPMLWLPPTLPHLRRDPLLLELGARDADAAGVFEAKGLYHELSDAVRRGCGLVDPIEPSLGLLAWTALRADASGDYLGPPIFIRSTDFVPPPVPSTGLPIGSLLAAYLSSAPVPVLLPPGRLAVRSFLKPPVPFRRVVAKPRLKPWPGDPDGWSRFREYLTAMPSPGELRRWYCRARTAWWGRYAIHRAFADLAGGVLCPFEGCGAETPASWFQSDVELDPVTGDIFVARDRRMPIARQVAAYPPGSVPPAVTALAEKLARLGKPAMKIQAGRRVIGASYGARPRSQIAAD